MKQPNTKHISLSLLLVSSVVAIVAVSRVEAGDPPATRPAKLLVDPFPNPPDPPMPIVWKSSGGKQDALIWKTDVDDAGSITVAGDVVLVGGRKIGHDDKSHGAMMALSRQTGKVIWTVLHDHLPERDHDMAANISSTPFVDGDRVYYVSNRGELCCVGLADGHVNWMLDMPAKLGVFKRDPWDVCDLAPSPIVVGDIVYCVTANGAALFTHPSAPDAPSFIAVDKMSGKVIWSSHAPGKEISYGQWGTPAIASVDRASEILFPGGDGALYAFEPKTGKQLWKTVCREPHVPKNFVPWELPEFITAPPLVIGDVAVVSPGLDVEFSNVSRPLLAIDLTKGPVRWSIKPKGFTGTLGPMACSDGTVYVASTSGLVLALDAETGKVRWTRDLDSPIYGGLRLNDGKLYVADNDGNLRIVSAADGHIVDECEVNNSFYHPAVVRDNAMYVISYYAVRAIRLPSK